MVVIVCGSRTWIDPEPIRMALKELPGGTLVVHGDAQGADRMAGEIALALGLPVKAVPARWNDLGPSAGIHRNQFLLDFVPDLVLAFCKNSDPRSGTMDMVKRARSKNIQVKVFFEMI